MIIPIVRTGNGWIFPENASLHRCNRLKRSLIEISVVVKERKIKATPAEYIAAELRSFPDVVGLDVEYIHFSNGDDEIVHPGEVCVVDAEGVVLYHSYCQPGVHMHGLRRLPQCTLLSFDQLTHGS
jgi:hypothetical protein